MKILILGKNGQVGWELNRAMLPLGDIIALDYPDIDFSKPDTLRNLIREIKPDVITNAVAYTAVDKAEDEEQLAQVINADAPALIADEAKKSGAVLIHYSTDYVFDGTKKEPYTETDKPNPLNAYGRTKLAGDLAIQASGCKHFIFRTSWVYGARGQNFLLTMLRLAKERKELKIVDDQIGAPTSSILLADIPTRLILEATRKKQEYVPYGMYHLTAGGATNWYEYARHVIERARASGWTIEVKPNSIYPIETKDYTTPARRPISSRLDTLKIRQTFGVELPHWRDDVDNILDQLM